MLYLPRELIGSRSYYHYESRSDRISLSMTEVKWSEETARSAVPRRKTAVWRNGIYAIIKNAAKYLSANRNENTALVISLKRQGCSVIIDHDWS